VLLNFLFGDQKIIMSIKKFLFTAILFLVTHCLYAQSKDISSIELLLDGNLSGPLSFNADYEPLLDSTGLATNSSLGFDVRINYSYQFASVPKIKVEGGLIYGVSSYRLIFSITKSFGNFTSSGFWVPIYGTEIKYIGSSLGIQYLIWKQKYNEIGVYGNISVVYFFPGFSELFWYDFESKNLKLLFYSPMTINEEKKVKIVPMGGIMFSHKINDRINISTNITGAWSKGYIMRTDPEYKIYGANDTLTGSYQKQFKYIGIGLGVSYRL